MKIVVVDDHVATMRALVARLEGWGHQVRGYTSSLEAIDSFARDSDVDLVITDWVMPESDGLTLSRAIKNFGSGTGVYVVMLTSRSETQEKIQALESGVDSFLAKPVDPSELRAVLQVVERQVQMQKNLEARVDELHSVQKSLKARHAELSDRNRELRVARELAEQAVRAKQDFLAQMSHELRTPMQAILTTFDVLRSSGLSLEQTELVTIAEGGAQNLLRILNDILDLSKIESGAMTFDQVEFRLSQVLYESLAPLRLQAVQKGLRFSCVQAKQIPDLVIGDPGRLAQILINLVGNALKFTEQGRIEVSVTLEPTQPEYCFSVVDTGPGIPEEDLETILEPFVQLRREGRTQPGTGLGLPLCKSMAVGMGGRLEVSSVLGQGSRFSLWLPLPQAQDGEADQDWQPFKNLTFACDRGRDWLKSLLEEKGLTYREDAPDVLFTESIAAIGSGPRVILLGEEASLEMKGSPNALLRPPVLEFSVLRALQVAFSEEDGRAGADRLRRDVLLVEDNPINTRVLVKALQQQGVDLETAENGHEAFEMFKEKSYGIVFMDMQMPVWDGIQSTRAIRAWEQEQEAEPALIVGLTAHALAEVEADFLASGVDAVLTKPVAVQQMMELIESRGPAEHV